MKCAGELLANISIERTAQCMGFKNMHGVHLGRRPTPTPCMFLLNMFVRRFVFVPQNGESKSGSSRDVLVEISPPNVFRIYLTF